MKTGDLVIAMEMNVMVTAGEVVAMVIHVTGIEAMVADMVLATGTDEMTLVQEVGALKIETDMVKEDLMVLIHGGITIDLIPPDQVMIITIGLPETREIMAGWIGSHVSFEMSFCTDIID